MCGDELNEFSFDLYNTSGSGSLTLEELRGALIKLHGKKDIEKKYNPVLELMDLDKNHDISKLEYMTHVRMFPVLVFPIFSVQVSAYLRFLIFAICLSFGVIMLKNLVMLIMFNCIGYYASIHYWRILLEKFGSECKKVTIFIFKYSNGGRYVSFYLEGNKIQM